MKSGLAHKGFPPPMTAWIRTSFPLTSGSAAVGRGICVQWSQRASPDPPLPPSQCRLSSRRRFFKSPNFDGWYRQRHKEMTQKLEALHLEAICEAVCPSCRYSNQHQTSWARNPGAEGAAALNTCWRISIPHRWMGDGALCPWESQLCLLALSAQEQQRGGHKRMSSSAPLLS